MSSPNDWIGLSGVLIGGLSLAGGFFLWWKGAIEKGYAAQRDFGHIRRSQEQILANLAALDHDLDTELDQLRAELKEVKAFSISLSQRFESILTRLESQSNIFGRRQQGD